MSTKLSERERRLRGLLRQTQEHLSYAAEMYGMDSETWHAEIKRLDRLMAAIRSELDKPGIPT